MKKFDNILDYIDWEQICEDHHLRHGDITPHQARRLEIILEDFVIQNTMTKQDEIRVELINIFDRINIDTPKNFDEILDFVVADVEESADKFKWHDGDVAQRANNINQYLCGTPSVIAMSALDAALDVWQDVDISQIREKSIALADVFIKLVKTHSCLSDLRLCSTDRKSVV